MKKAFTLLAAVLLLFAVPFGALAAGEEKIVAKGIDVSYANYGNGKTVDFNKAKADGIRFVIIRAGYSGKGLSNTQKETLPDTHFELNCKNAAAAGLKIGVYYYSYAKTVAEAERDAADCLRFVKNKQLEYPIYYDMEDEKCQGGLTTRQRTDIALAFTRKVQQAGYMAGVYANKNWFTNYLDLNAIQKECEIWLAHYPRSDKPDIDYSAYGLWQYASDGKVNGLYLNGQKTNVDVNVAYRDYPTLIRIKGLNGFAKNTYKPAAEKQDINCDGVLDLKDAALLARYTAGQSNLELNASVVSYNGSGAPANLKNVVELVRRLLEQN